VTGGDPFIDRRFREEALRSRLAAPSESTPRALPPWPQWCVAGSLVLTLGAAAAAADLKFDQVATGPVWRDQTSGCMAAVFPARYRAHLNPGVKLRWVRPTQGNAFTIASVGLVEPTSAELVGRYPELAGQEGSWVEVRSTCAADESASATRGAGLVGVTIASRALLDASSFNRVAR
jgi:hypothetical protein